MTRLVYMTKLEYGDDKYIAVGSNRDRRRLYLVDGGRLFRTKLFFPDCTRFMPFVEVDDDERVKREDIEQEYGPLPKSIKGPMVGSR